VTALRAPAGIRLLALDIDGTIAPEEGVPPAHIVAAIHEVHAAGVEIMLVTGRPLHAVREVGQALGLDELWVGSSNGAVTSMRGPGEWGIVATESFDPRPAVEAVLAADPEAGIVIEEPGQGYRVSRTMPSAIGQDPHLPWLPVPRATTFAALASRVLALDALTDLVADKGANVMPWRWDGWEVVDLQPAHVSKATAVQQLAAKRGLGAHECAAVGDFLNDIDMLTWVGWGVAMGHAPPEVKAVADAVAPSLDQDGILAVTAALLAATA
jgi:hydroxymethylpyrimidine pyrophosphatase-like HAD family hydrolase